MTFGVAKFDKMLLTASLLFSIVHLSDAAYFSQFSMNKPEHDPCEDASGRPIKCVPDFINAAYGKPVIASSTCGQNGPSRFCTIHEGAKGIIKEVCDACDSNDKSRAHPASLITDFNNAKNLTCWISEPSNFFNQTVSLTLSLGKKFELTYISMTFCNRLADSLAIYKSMDFGKTWMPFQFYSSHCKNMYDREEKDSISQNNEQEAICSNAHALSAVGDRIAFATLEGRPSAFRFEQSPILQDWVTATDIRIIFNKPSISNTQLYAIQNAESNNVTADISEDIISKSYYSMAELAVGGRCKCNGHASRCVYDKKGQFSCDCKHNTFGPDCERCKPFHYDRPWARATSESANNCVACNCNLHARKCRFNSELFRLSGNKSGGICINCRHNTAGRNCHYCKPGYYRDNTKAISAKRACKVCGCHPVGSLSKNCNQTSGQCICKPGVAGMSCNRCAIGYRQTSNPATPCIKKEKAEIESKKIECDKCKVNPKRINLKKFCKHQYALQIYMISREIVDNFSRYNISVEKVYKKQGLKIKKGAQFLFVPEKMLHCKCPKIRIGQRYLVLGANKQKYSNKAELIVSPQSIVVDWEDSFVEKLNRFANREKDGECEDSEEV